MSILLNSLRREASRLRQSPWDLAMVSWVPLLAVALIAWIFSAGLPRQLPIGVLDEDHSVLSRQLVRMLQATPGLSVADSPLNLAEAEGALRAARVYAVVHIPRDFAREVKQGRVGEVTLLHNAQLATHSGLIQRDVRTAVGTLSAGVEMAARNKRGEATRSVRVSMTPVPTRLLGLFNVAGNYEPFLASALVPALLHILAMTAGAWALGRELRDGSIGPWLAGASRAQAGAALAGKLAIPWASLTLVGWLGLAWLSGGRGWHPPGSIAWVALSVAALMAVSVAGGAALAGLTRSLRTALSACGFFSAPAFAFSGVGFPLAAMSPGARAWAEAMPYTHHIRLQMDQWLLGAPVAQSVPTALALWGAAALLMAVAVLTAHRAAGQPASWGGR